MKTLTIWSIALVVMAYQPSADHESEQANTAPPAARPVAAPNAPEAADTAATVATKPAAAPPAAPVRRRYAYQVRPGDDTKGNTELQSFVRRVIGYTRNRQRAALVAVADDSIAISYGDGIFGKKEFGKFLDDPEWGAYSQIQKALQLGGAQEEEKSGEWAYLFPYCQSQQRWTRVPEDEEADPYMTYFGLVPDLKVHQNPSAGSPIKAQLAWRTIKTTASRVKRTGLG